MRSSRLAWLLIEALEELIGMVGRPVSLLPAVLAVKGFGREGSSVSGAGGISSSFFAMETTEVC